MGFARTRMRNAKKSEIIALKSDITRMKIPVHLAQAFPSVFDLPPPIKAFCGIFNEFGFCGKLDGIISITDAYDAFTMTDQIPDSPPVKRSGIFSVIAIRMYPGDKAGEHSRPFPVLGIENSLFQSRVQIIEICRRYAAPWVPLPSFLSA